MKVDIYPNRVEFKREPSDKAIYRDSTLWYHIKEHMNKQLGLKGRNKLVKKLMYKDGHLYGDDKLHYIVTGDAANKVGEVWMVYDGNYAVRSMYQAYNVFQPITLILDKYSNETIIWTNHHKTKIVVELIHHDEGWDKVRLKVVHNGVPCSVQETHVRDYRVLTVDNVMDAMVAMDKESLQEKVAMRHSMLNPPFERIV